MKQTIVVFISLLLDLLAFTLILPLFPKIFDYYAANQNDSTYSILQYSVDKFRNYLIGSDNQHGFNAVLFGGFIGSLFSFLQFLSSTFMGAASDMYGRKAVLLLAMFGTLLSYLMWSVSIFFIIFLMSRVIGGISKANVSICIAIMTDLSDMTTRSSAMALVGIAFSLGFIFGPIIGALFSASSYAAGSSIHIYPAYFAIALTLLNIVFVSIFLQESLPVDKRAKSVKSIMSRSFQFVNPVALFNFSAVKSVSSTDLTQLKTLGLANFLYLFLYSGLEFTLTFLVHNRFNYNSVQQGKMFLFMGVLMTLIQGGYVRRIKAGSHLKACIKAILLLIPGFIVIAIASKPMVFYFGLALYSYSSAVVVQCFTTMISNYGSDNEKGTLTGINRSLGSLARALGPVFTSMIYWTFGPTFAYILGSLALTVPLCSLIRLQSQQMKLAKAN